MGQLMRARESFAAIVASAFREYFRPLVEFASLTGVVSENAIRRLVGSTHRARRKCRSFEEDLLKVAMRPLNGNTDLIRHLGLPDSLTPAVLMYGDHLSETAASIGFGNLEFVARALVRAHRDKEPYLFGVNRGGVILANLLADRLALHHKQFVRCDFRADWNRVVCEHRPNVSFAIVVDDVVRTGTTLSAVRTYFRENHPDAELYVLALVVTVAPKSAKKAATARLLKLADYYPWISYERHTVLPWSHKNSNEPADYIKEDGINQVVARLISQSPMAGDHVEQ